MTRIKTILQGFMLLLISWGIITLTDGEGFWGITGWVLGIIAAIGLLGGFMLSDEDLESLEPKSLDVGEDDSRDVLDKIHDLIEAERKATARESKL